MKENDRVVNNRQNNQLKKRIQKQSAEKPTESGIAFEEKLSKGIPERQTI